jgi:hypothetical protein
MASAESNNASKNSPLPPVDGGTGGRFSRRGGIVGALRCEFGGSVTVAGIIYSHFPAAVAIRLPARKTSSGE